jgi:hypothetical protein
MPFCNLPAAKIKTKTGGYANSADWQERRNRINAVKTTKNPTKSAFWALAGAERGCVSV